MESISHIVHRGFELALSPLGLLPPLVGVTLIGMVTGALLLWLVGKTTSQKLVERARNQMTARIYEMRLYLDRPGRVFKAQGRLLLWSVVYVVSMLPALLVSALPLALLFVHLEARYGLVPLPVNKPVLVRVELLKGMDGNKLDVQPPSGVKVTAPLLFLEGQGDVYVRVVPETAAEHRLVFAMDGKTVEKSLRTTGMAAPERRSGISTWWQIGPEPPTGSPAITGIFLTHPENPRSWFGIPWWWGYWLLIATITALALKSRFDVAI